MEQELRILLDKPGELSQDQTQTRPIELQGQEAKTCLCVYRAPKNSLRSQERGGAYGETGGDCQ